MVGTDALVLVVLTPLRVVPLEMASAISSLSLMAKDEEMAAVANVSS